MKGLSFYLNLALASAALIRCQETNTTISLEAEDAVLSGNTAVATEQTGFSGEYLLPGPEAILA